MWFGSAELSYLQHIITSLKNYYYFFYNSGKFGPGKSEKHIIIKLAWPRWDKTLMLEELAFTLQNAVAYSSHLSFTFTSVL